MRRFNLFETELSVKASIKCYQNIIVKYFKNEKFHFFPTQMCIKTSIQCCQNTFLI